MSDEYECVDREHGLWKKRKEPKDPNVNADRLALALSLETVQELERENAALREALRELLSVPMTVAPQTVPKAGEDVAPAQVIYMAHIALSRLRRVRSVLDAARKEAQP